MTHLILSREFTPSAHAAGGITTYIRQVTRELVARGEAVRVISQQWPGAPKPLESFEGGQLIVHRVSIDEPLGSRRDDSSECATLRRLREQGLPCQAFQWQAARLAESLIDEGKVDLIEAQDYEAPSYVFQLRRNLGLAKARGVPLIVHLHSPTEFVVRANGWDESPADLVALAQLEEYVIRTADAHLCPSQFLARQAEARYGLGRGAVHVIPYPIGDTPVIDRPAERWHDGSICYVGRLEPRKGVIEWIDAAVDVLSNVTDLRFTFIGGDVASPGAGEMSMWGRLQRQIPANLRSRFSFSGARPHAEVASALADARIAVVPSRWENFPYTCIEAMATGLPVVVSPSGGMVEMIEDGRTGWVAAGADSWHLADALRRAVATPPESLAYMGANAAAAIRMQCGNEAIAARQIEFRRNVVRNGVTGTVSVPRPQLPPPFVTLVAGRDDLFPQAESNLRTTMPHATVLGERTLTPGEVLRAPAEVKRAIARRAVSDPVYVLRWLAWHAKRATVWLRHLSPTRKT